MTAGRRPQETQLPMLLEIRERRKNILCGLDIDCEDFPHPHTSVWEEPFAKLQLLSCSVVHVTAKDNYAL